MRFENGGSGPVKWPWAFDCHVGWSEWRGVQNMVVGRDESEVEMVHAQGEKVEKLDGMRDGIYDRTIDGRIYGMYSQETEWVSRMKLNLLGISSPNPKRGGGVPC
jgi:hypothetical protein